MKKNINVRQAMLMTTTAIVLAASMMAAPVLADNTARGTGTQATAGDTFTESGISDESVGSNAVVNGTFDSALGGKGSITIKGKEDQTLNGKRFEIFRLFNSQDSKDKESINYTFNEKYQKAVQTVVFEALQEAGELTDSEKTYADITEYRAIDFIQSLNTHPAVGVDADQQENGYYSKFRYFVENVRTEIKNEGLSGLFVKVDSASSENTAKITGLPYGYYIVDERSTSTVGEDGQNFAAALLMVNTVNKDVEMTVKSDIPSVIKKIQEDDNKEQIGNDGYNDIGDYEIGDSVPYYLSSTVPDMNGKNTYFFAFHDKANEALTPYLEKTDNKENPAQAGVTVTIDGIGADGKAKTYTLAADEYVIAEQGSNELKPDGKTKLVDAGDTFVVAITDLKAIVDREFPHFDENGHNDYFGATVRVDYTMTINEKAAKETGRPGMENKTRLEFSNNMDSNGGGDTGYTPWDTVVAFTFKLDGLKTNEYDKALEGAKFRLYSDEKMTNEVVLVEREDGYIVQNRDSLGGEDHTGGTITTGVEIVSDGNGDFVIYGLDQGTYYLKETQAPEGYRLLEKPIELTITPTYAENRNSYVQGDGATDKILKTLEATAKVSAFYDGVTKNSTTNLATDVEEGSANLIVVNEVGSKLPVTGSAGVLIMLGAGVAMMGGSTFIGKKRKKEDKN